MSKRKTELQWPPDAPAPDDLPRVDGDDAPAAPDPEPEPVLAAAPAPTPPHPGADAPGSPVAADEPPPPEPSPWHDIPVASVLPPVAPLLPASTPSPLEERLHRLEAELARLHAAAPAAAPSAPPDPAASVVRQPGGFWGGVRKTLLAPSGPSAAPPPKTDHLASLVPPGVRRGWLLLDALRELRAMYCMFFDPRYRLSWLGRLAPLAVAVLILTSSLWMPGTGLPWPLGMIIDKVADLVLAYFLFKLLSHEARRYRETAPDLPPSLRL